MENKTLWILCGAPASGKTYYIKHHLMHGTGWMHISRDEVRFSIVQDEEEYFSHEKEVYKEFIYRIYKALDSEGIFNVVADATHLNWASRHKLIENLKKIYPYFDTLDIIPIVVKSDVELMVRRNAERTGREQVPVSALRRMNMQFSDPKNDPYEYTSIMYVNNNERQVVEKPRFMYKKSDIQMKEYTIQDIIEREG